MNMMRRSFLGFLTSLAFIGSANAEGEAEARKAASTAQLKKEGVPFIDHLPTIETQPKVGDERRMRWLNAPSHW